MNIFKMVHAKPLSDGVTMNINPSNVVTVQSPRHSPTPLCALCVLSLSRSCGMNHSCNSFSIRAIF